MNSPVKTAVYAISILVASALAAYLLKVTAPEHVTKLRKLPPTQIGAHKMRSQTLYPQIRLTGRLQPAHKASLKFELSGRVAKRLVEPGQKVEKGTVLLELANGDYQDAFTEAKAKFTLEKAGIARDKRLHALAHQNSILQQKEVARLTRLGRGALVSKSLLGKGRQQLFQLKAEEARFKYSVDTAQARLSLRKSAMERAARNLARTRLTAPFSGIINTVTVQQGDFVVLNKSVVNIVSVEQLELKLQVRTVVASKIVLGSKVGVEINGKELEGKVVALQADPDATTYTHLLRIRVAGNSGAPGQIAEVVLKLGRLEHVLAVPASAVIHAQGAAYVMVITDKTVHRRSVMLGKRVENWQIVVKGLKAGENIVGSDTSGLKEGQAVKVQ